MPELLVSISLNPHELRWLRMAIAKATDAKLVEWADGLSWIARLDVAKRAAMEDETTPALIAEEPPKGSVPKYPRRRTA